MLPILIHFHYQHEDRLHFPPPSSSNFSPKVEKLLKILPYLNVHLPLPIIELVHFYYEDLHLFRLNILLFLFLSSIECSQWLHSIEDKKGTSSSWDSQ